MGRVAMPLEDRGGGSRLPSFLSPGRATARNTPAEVGSDMPTRRAHSKTGQSTGGIGPTPNLTQGGNYAGPGGGVVSGGQGSERADPTHGRVGGTGPGSFQPRQDLVQRAGGGGEPSTGGGHPPWGSPQGEGGLGDLGAFIERRLNARHFGPGDISSIIDEARAARRQAEFGPGDLAGMIEELFHGPGPMQMEEIQEMRDALAQQREEERGVRAGQIATDAAGRGTFFGSTPAFQRGELEEELAEREAMADAQMTTDAARMLGQQRQAAVQAGIPTAQMETEFPLRLADIHMRGALGAAQHQGQQEAQAISEAFRFLENAQQGAQNLYGMGQGAFTGGMHGAPTIGQGLQALLGFGGGAGAGGMDPSLFAMLGSIIQGG